MRVVPVRMMLPALTMPQQRNILVFADLASRVRGVRQLSTCVVVDHVTIKEYVRQGLQEGTTVAVYHLIQVLIVR